MPPSDNILFPRTVRILLQSWQLKGMNEIERGKGIKSILGLCQEARHEYKQAANTYRELLDLAKRSYNNLTNVDPLAKPYIETALCNLPLLQFEYFFSSTLFSSAKLLQWCVCEYSTVAPSLVCAIWAESHGITRYATASCAPTLAWHLWSKLPTTSRGSRYFSVWKCEMKDNTSSNKISLGPGIRHAQRLKKPSLPFSNHRRTLLLR